MLELTRAAQEGVGGSAVPDLLGGTPAEQPDRYELADPSRRLPLGVPVRCVHPKGDGNVPFDQSTGYVAAAGKAGDDATLVEVDGDHFTLIDPATPAWAAVVELLPGLA